MNVIRHHYQSLNKKEIKKKKKLGRIQVRSNRTTGIPGNRSTHLRNKYITSINKSCNTGEESGNREIRDRLMAYLSSIARRRRRNSRNRESMTITGGKRN